MPSQSCVRSLAGSEYRGYCHDIMVASIYSSTIDVEHCGVADMKQPFDHAGICCHDKRIILKGDRL